MNIDANKTPTNSFFFDKSIFLDKVEKKKKCKNKIGQRRDQILDIIYVQKQMRLLVFIILWSSFFATVKSFFNILDFNWNEELIWL